MTAKHGEVGEFDNSQEDWDTYVERVSLYLIANDVTNAEKKRAILLSVCGTRTYHVIRDLVAPRSPKDLSFDEIVETVRDHYNPKPVVTVQRYKFNSRTRREGEMVATFVAELRHLAIHCEFGDSLNDMLQDRLICGVNDPGIQHRLLSEGKIDFAKALELAQATETAD